MTVPVAVLASGSGTNLQAMLEFEARELPPWRIVLVASDRDDAYALERARKAGREARIIPVRGRTQEEVGEETLRAFQEADIQVILLAGYLRLFPDLVIRAYPRRILNLHPALLPFFGGKGMYGHHVHRAVLDAGCLTTPDSLAERIHRIEHVLYPVAADQLCRAVAEGREAPRFSLPADAFGACFDENFENLFQHITGAFGTS